MICSRRNKKGVAYFAIMLFLVVLVSMILLTIAFLQNLDFFKDNKIGERQAKIIDITLRGERAQFFLFKSAKTSAYSALNDLSSKGGFFGQSTCGINHDTNLWTCDGQTSYPVNPSIDFKSFFTPYLSRELLDYQEEFFPRSDFILNVKSDGKITGKSQLPMTFQKTKVMYPRLIDLNVSSEKIDISWDPNDVGRRIVDDARKYAVNFKGYPYVWGGVSPYPYELTLADQNINPDSFFKGVYLHEIIPPGNKMSGLPIMPGFDCSGFVWWTLHHLNLVEGRLTAHGYYEWSKNNGRIICDDSNGQPCSEDLIRKHAQNGDLLFINKNLATGKFGHIGIYEEEWRLIDSSGSRGVESRDIPNNYKPGEPLAISAVYRLDYAKLKTKIPAPSPSLLGAQSAQTSPVTNNYVYDASPNQDDELIYSITPSFKIDLGYDFEYYNELRKQSSVLITLVEECEKLGGNLDECIKDSVSSQLSRYGWSTDCYNESEQLVYGLMDSFEECFESVDDSCYCDVKLPISESFDDNDYEITFVDQYTHAVNKLAHQGQQGTVPSGTPDDLVLEYGTNDKGVSEVMKKYEYQFARSKVSDRKKLVGDIVLEVEYSDVPGVSVDNLEIRYNGDDFILKDSVLILKDRNRVVFLVDIDKNTLQGEGYNECRLEQKRERNFCVKDPVMKTFNYDGLRRKYVMENLEYRFGLFFKKPLMQATAPIP